MDGFQGTERVNWLDGSRVIEAATKPRRWKAHNAHTSIAAPHRLERPRVFRPEEFPEMSLSSSPTSSAGDQGRVLLDGSRGEGGGQILRTALTLSLLTGRPFRIVKIRANRDKPGLRPQHQKAVEAAAALGEAKIVGNAVGARELAFSPGARVLRDLTIDIGTAGSTSLVLQTLHPPIALRAENPVHLLLTGGTFNPKAPAFLFLDATWRAYLSALGMPLTLTMPSAGFYPRGGGRLEAWIEPATPRPIDWTDRAPLRTLHGKAGISNLREDIARRMRDRALDAPVAPRPLGRDRPGKLAQPRAGGRDRADRRARRGRSRHLRRPGRTRQAGRSCRRRGGRSASRLRGRRARRGRPSLRRPDPSASGPRTRPQCIHRQRSHRAPSHQRRHHPRLPRPLHHDRRTSR